DPLKTLANGGKPVAGVSVISADSKTVTKLPDGLKSADDVKKAVEDTLKAKVFDAAPPAAPPSPPSPPAGGTSTKLTVEQINKSAETRAADRFKGLDMKDSPAVKTKLEKTLNDWL